MTPFHALLAVIVSTAIACQEADHADSKSCAERPVRMGVASSLREVALDVREELANREAGIEVETIFGSSSVHARQIRLGAPLDLLVSADAKIVSALIEGGLLVPGSDVEVARGRLSLVVRADHPLVPAARAVGSSTAASARHILESPDVERIAIPPRAVPLGRYARTWLDGKGLLEDLRGRIVVTEHARATLSVVDAGLADLAIVYASDARLAKSAVVAARVDPRGHPPIRYVAARVAAAPTCDSIDEALLAWSTPRSLDRFAALGFLPPQRAEVRGVDEPERFDE